ncbi:MAG: bifunctional nicotinamide-nucleotide adenylyltransferase/Nudix hydroxylase [Gammaproteobacteria bacterium]|jgi:bifunctional NMN adenylyltransferase/nudix hydrolase|nr:bifunctional nicotinamide-nucleotide adenylyltransferase/Nudix hydroxylase [Gammaproteobacteria bacterium]
MTYKKIIDFEFLPDDIEDLYNGKVHDGQYDVLVFIGRFSPFHKGHKAVVDVALKKAKKVIILVGSSFRSRTERNPFNFQERQKMINASFTDQENEKIVILPIRDMTYRDHKWISQVQEAVKEEILNTANEGTGSFRPNGTQDVKVGLIGCEKDHTSYYLKKFPMWGSVGVKFVNPLNATDIRRAYFAGGEAWANVKILQHLPDGVVNFLDHFAHSFDYEYVQNEMAFNRKNKAAWANAPYAPTFNAADSVIIQSGHILLVTRRSHPGKGLLALPGGYLNQEETLLDCALRELREETKIKVPEKVLRGSMVYDRNFDDPYRSDRGRMITQAFLFQLEDMDELPKVKGSDDAEKAKWYPIAFLNEEDFFEDHYHIIQVMLGHMK